MKRIYLDNASSVPIERHVLKAIKPYLTNIYGNPSSLHREGKEASMAIENARERVASLLNCKTTEIFFISGASEANSWIAKTYNCTVSVNSHTSMQLAKRKNPKKKSIIAMSLVNSETGIYADLEEITKPLYLDATQAIAHFEVDIQELNEEANGQLIALSFSGHKLGAPKGIGVMYIKEDVQSDFVPLIYGKQERGLRGGTENVAGIIGIAKALEIKNKNNIKNAKKMLRLIDILRKGMSNFPLEKCTYNAGVCNITFNTLHAQTAVTIFDEYGVAISAGSACDSKTDIPSESLILSGYTPHQALRTVRISLGTQTTKWEVKKFLKILKEVIDNFDNL